MSIGTAVGLMPATSRTPEPFTTTFTFDWVKAPLSLNYRMHRMAAAKITKEIRSLMHASARRIPDLGKCRVELVWWVNTKTRRDEENIVPVLKALCDGLVDAEVVEDDTPEYMVKMMPEIRYVKKRERVACFEFTITEVAA
ncbi:hypothetical protein [Cryobacterium sp. Sr8]|uniref:hypothetical protein n=1 Tax=Cryobacterium sp. Sr8 TaxID=1259203 RepID=UPI001582EBCC|nr:hypothetical protein [Cryobacterium sp. Sr8]